MTTDRPNRRGFFGAIAAALALPASAPARTPVPTRDPATPRTWSTLAFDPATGTEIVTLREGPNTFLFSRTGPDYRLRQIAPRPGGGPCYTSPPTVSFSGNSSGATATARLTTS